MNRSEPVDYVDIDEQDLGGEQGQKYRAPALEKGLDILELLAQAQAPLTLSQISQRLDRSVSELFRMAQVLEARGYILQSARADGFELTNKLFSLGISRAPNQNLLSNALPLMQDLCERIRQACHLAIATDGKIVVIACIEAPGYIGFAVRPGYHRPLCRSTSGLILYGFQNPTVRDTWRAALRKGLPMGEWEKFEAAAELGRAQGYVTAKSSYADGIIDVACPVLNATACVAALTIPYINTTDSLALEEVAAQLKATAHSLSHLLTT